MSPLIEIDGASAHTASGLVLAGGSSGSLVSGLIVGGFTGDGIVILSSNNSIQASYLGTSASGTAALANSSDGIAIFSGATGNTIGGASASEGNVISGNASDGIDLDGASSNLLENNLIGTTESGTSGLANASTGIAAYGGASNNTISGNVVSDNVYGVALDGTGTSGNVLTDNLIGVVLVAGAKSPLPNQYGVLLQAGSSDNTVGGASLAQANVISGNSNTGISIGNSSETGNLVENNFIGTDSASDPGLGNVNGVLFFGDANGGPTDNTIGAGNVISGNTYVGVAIYDTGTSDNVVSGDRIGTNAQGTGALANANGVIIGASASGNTIGGSTSAAANVISGNSNDAVQLTNAGTTGNVVAGDLIGTNAAGTAAVANGNDGVIVSAGASSNMIGGAVAGDRNLISGNSGVAVVFTGAGTTGNTATRDWLGLNAPGTGSLANLAGVAFIDGSSANSAIDDVISGNTALGIAIIPYSTSSGSNDNVIQGDLIGTDPTGTVAMGNSGPGVEIDGGSTGNTIGGTTAGQGNIISANISTGVSISGSGTSGNVVLGNEIGTQSGGTAALGNATDGVDIGSGRLDNTIGGTASGAANVISGNTLVGISIAGASGNLIEGNLIGTDTTGSTALANGEAGMIVDGSSTNNTIGGTASGAGNLISGNTGDGIAIDDAGTTGNVVQGNKIGTNLAGSAAVPNTVVGVDIYLGPTDNTIGGTATGALNLISGNTLDGVDIGGAGTSGNVLLGNLIGTNSTGSVAIANGGSGVSLFDGGIRQLDWRHGLGRGQRDLGERFVWRGVERNRDDRQCCRWKLDRHQRARQRGPGQLSRDLLQRRIPKHDRRYGLGRGQPDLRKRLRWN